MALASVLLDSLYLLCLVGGVAAAGYVLARYGEADRPGYTDASRPLHAKALVATLLLMAAWSAGAALLGQTHWFTVLTLWLGYASAVQVLFRMSQHWGQDLPMSGQPARLLYGLSYGLKLAIFLALIAIVVAPLVAGSASSWALAGMAHWLASIEPLIRLLVCTGGLVLLHNLYSGASRASQRHLRCGCTALALLWAYDLNLATLAYISGTPPVLLGKLRVAVVLLALCLIVFGVALRGGVGRFYPSRTIAFQSLSLLLIGGYWVAIVLAARGLAYVSGDWALITQGLVVAAAVLAVAVFAASGRVRGWLRVSVAKHLFQHRYDYRAEWQRLTHTLSLSEEKSGDLPQRVIQALCDITECPAGRFYAADEARALGLAASWKWDEPERPDENAGLPPGVTDFLEVTRYIVELDAVRADGGPLVLPHASDGLQTLDVPQWLQDDSRAWVIVPLLHYDRLAGAVILARPLIDRRLDWEDFDLLRVVGGQLAGYLVEQAAQRTLLETQQFAAFNRSIAFAMHDIKNLASQLSLLSRNAQQHAANPDFRADMLVTLQSSAERLQTLLGRLGQLRPGMPEPPLSAPSPDRISLASLLAGLSHAYAKGAVVVNCDDAQVERDDAERLEQALHHLVQNALDANGASPDSGYQRPIVTVSAVCAPNQAVIEVSDNGPGMSESFIRNALFRPFHSSKAHGYGIGAYEARALIRAIGGVLLVTSAEGIGTRFRITLPLGGQGAARSHRVPADPPRITVAGR